MLQLCILETLVISCAVAAAQNFEVARKIEVARHFLILLLWNFHCMSWVNTVKTFNELIHWEREAGWTGAEKWYSAWESCSSCTGSSCSIVFCLMGFIAKNEASLVIFLTHFLLNICIIGLLETWVRGPCKQSPLMISSKCTVNSG